MANPRDLAEQAFALLQNALEESEARASDLDEQLKRKRQPKTRVEEQVDVLSHKLESVEAERQRWERQAGQLEELVEGERAKVAQLKKKLEVAESGPEKLTKKEINFWRAKAEGIDTEINDYKERLAALRRELNERDAQLERLSAKGAATEAEPAESSDAASASDELRRQLEQRDSWLAELRLELHELRAQPTPPLETQAEVETLRAQTSGLERALAEAHNARAAAQADLTRVEHELAERERILREASATNERARTALAEREHRLVELSAEVEQLRTELGQRDDRHREVSAGHDERVATLVREVEALRSRLEQDRADTAAARASLQDALDERERELDKQRQLLAANEDDFRNLEQRNIERDAALEDHRRQLAERQQAAADAYRQLSERDRELADSRQQLRELAERLADHDRQGAANVEKLEEARAASAARASQVERLEESLARASEEIERLKDSLQSSTQDLEHARTTLTANERELASLRETLLASSRELDELRAHKQRLEAALADTATRADRAADEMAAAREQMAGLESELKEEREHAESLGELANERREHMTKLQEQVEEAEERYAEANWRLGKSLYFERIVTRRKGLVVKLLEALRAKMKANTALKAGIDGLRTYKAAAEMTQEKLLKRIDGLKAELIEADETVKRHQGGTAAKEELTNAIARATALEERLNTQAELIQSLEADLKTARLAHTHKPGDDRYAEIERLRKELETKNEVIVRLEADIDDQQRKLSKLRGSESETMRLKAISEKERGEIDGLHREIAELREALTRQTQATETAANGTNSELEGRLKEREQSVTRLMGTIKEHEATIKKLTESADGWKRKYQFLATDSPDAYKGNAEK